MSKHSYKPLSSSEHIRIITLHPSENESADLTCSIKQVKLDDEVEKYECISYAWGEPVFSHRLYCDDGSVFELTSSLHSALTRFRSKHREGFRNLWADAICINQTDITEKSQQIPLMARIYHGSLRVLVWLGEGQSGESGTLAWLSRLTRMSSVVHENGGDSQLLVARMQTLLANHHEEVMRLLETPWFRRRWIIQEVALNPDVVLHCGSSKVSWQRFILAIQIWSKWDTNLTMFATHISAVLKLGSLWKAWSLLADAPKECELVDLLDTFEFSECAEAKDRLFALAGLATDVRETFGSSSTTWRMNIVTDYSLPTHEVYRRFVLQRMESGRVLSTLSFVGTRRTEISQLPSWIPDLTAPKRHHSFLIEDAILRFHSHGSGLQLRGTLKSLESRNIDNFVGEPTRMIVNEPNFPALKCGETQVVFDWVRACWELVREAAIFTPTRFLSIAEFCNVLMANGARLEHLSPQRREAIKSFWNFESILNSGPEKWVIGVKESAYYLLRLFNHTEVSSADLKAVEPLLDLVYETMKGRCLFFGSLGRLPIRDSYRKCAFLVNGPDDLQKGDIGVVFSGTSYPLFLRQASSRTYRFLGDGYFESLYPTDDRFGHDMRFRVNVSPSRGKDCLFDGEVRDVEIALV